MAEKAQQLILDALQRLAAEPAGLPAFASKTAPGLFANNAAGKQAVQQCQDAGLVRAVRTETRGKTTVEIWALSEKGLALLLDEANPKQVLETFVQTLESRRGQFDDLVVSARAGQQQLADLAETIRQVLQRLHEPRPVACNGHANGHAVEDKESQLLIEHLRSWHESGKLGDCPLPQLYRATKSTIGQFHDRLRNLHGRERIYLHPWTGPLYEIPEPSLALLIGHEIAYYANLRV